LYLLKGGPQPKTFDAVLEDVKHFQRMGERGLIDGDNMARFLNVLNAVATNTALQTATETDIKHIKAACAVLLKQSEKYEDKFLKKVKHTITLIDDAIKFYENAKEENVRRGAVRAKAKVEAKAPGRRAADERLVQNRKTLRRLHKATHGAAANNSNSSSNNSSSNSSGRHSHSSSGSSSGSSSRSRSGSKSKTRKANGNRSRSGNGASRHRIVPPKTANNKGNNE